MPTRDRLLAAVVAVLWGANFLAIHVGLQHFPPLFLAALRFAVIALPTVLLVPRPQVRLRWLLGYGLGFGTLQFLFLFVAMDVGMPTGLASLVLQASAPFRAKPDVRFVHNGDMHFRKQPCLRCETLGGLEAGAVNTCGLFDLQRIF